MAAAGSRCDDDRIRRLRIDLLHERRGDFQRQVVFSLERAKRPGHAATAGIEQGNGATGQTPRQPSHKAGFYERLRVAMRVDRDMGRAVSETKCVRFTLEQVVDEMLE